MTADLTVPAVSGTSLKLPPRAFPCRRTARPSLKAEERKAPGAIKAAGGLFEMVGIRPSDIIDVDDHYLRGAC
jgi:hypothetical protein